MSMGKGGQPRVLLVEDEPAQRTVLAYNLEAEGFAVTQADNGEDAMVLVDEEEPDIIILDWMMPKVSGIEVCRRLKMRPGDAGHPGHHAVGPGRGGGPHPRAGDRGG
jgi:two-component system phosphate regulon response regulator PhoB